MENAIGQGIGWFLEGRVVAVDGHQGSGDGSPEITGTVIELNDQNECEVNLLFPQSFQLCDAR